MMLTIAVPALADSTTSISVSAKAGLKREQASSTRAMIKDKIKEKTSSFCTGLTSRIDKRLSSFDMRFQSHADTYQEHYDKLVQISTKLKTDGVSTTKLDADIVLLDAKVAKFRNDKLSVEAGLNNTKGFACGNSDGQFKASIEALHVAQKIVMADAKDIHDFIMGTLKDDIVSVRADYKAQVKAN